ncbi:MAG TPA: protein translocase subunit SecD, partial [Sulfurimonas sp.]|nr:protein translocase subunit SecD [Sulfurimonas sp.]
MKLNYRVVIFLAAFIFGLAFSIPTLTNSDKGAKITLGLDLQGGLHMLLGVKTEEAVKARFKSIAASIKYFTGKNDILVDTLEITDEGVEFSILDEDDLPALNEMLSKTEGLIVDEKDLSFSLSFSDEEVERTKKQSVAQAVETIRNRLDMFGLSEPTVAKQGEEKILVELPGIKSQEEEQRARELISRAAYLQLMAVDEERKMRVYQMSDAEAAKYGDIILPDAEQEGVKYLIKEIQILDGSMLTDASVQFDPDTNQPVISFALNSEGAAIFGDFTEKNVGNHLAVVLDGKVFSAPVKSIFNLNDINNKS